MEFNCDLMEIPSGRRSHNYGKFHHVIAGKLTINDGVNDEFHLFTLWSLSNSLPLKMAIEISEFSKLSGGGSFHSYVNLHQRVNEGFMRFPKFRG